MSVRQPINLFYEEHDPDRWIRYDRYPRRVIRRLVRGPMQPGGAMRVFLNLKAGLDLIGVPYRDNDYSHARRNREELACLIGKPHVLKRFWPETPLLFGTSMYNHPTDDISLPRRHRVRQVLVPSAWVQRMFSELWPGLVSAWPVGVDTERWTPRPAQTKDVDILFYDKILKRRAHYRPALIEPLLAELRRQGLVVEYMRYGSYVEPELLELSRRVKGMLYLSSHETQGIALQQMLSANVPVLAWDPGGDWPNLEYLLRGIRFGPVTTVPYWDDRCGVKFVGNADFASALARFLQGVKTGAFEPRQMILDSGLTLQAAAQRYVEFVDRYS